jgi:hypothetical protein
MIFNSDEFASLMRSNDMDFTKVFESSDSAAALFRSTDFLKSLDAYKESLAKAPAAKEDTANGDPLGYFRSVDFLRSLDSLPKDSASRPPASESESESKIDYSSYFKSIDTLPKDLFKSLDLLSKKTPVSAPVLRSGPSDLYTSRDWIGTYHPSHVDVTYDKKLFQTSESKDGATVATDSTTSNKWMKMYESGLKKSATSPPPTAKAPATWKGMYENILLNPLQNVADTSLSTAMPPLVAAEATPAAVASASASASENADSSDDQKKPSSGKPRKKRVYKSRKVIPEVKTYVDFTDDDVLLGRGGLSNRHPGNRRYREEIENAKDVYRSASKEEKTQWASLLVDYVKKYGGRFLEKDKANGQWYIVPEVVARRKAGQALREDNTPESRAEKRERYKRNHQKNS